LLIEGALSQKFENHCFKSILFWLMKSARMIVFVGEALLCNDVKIIITLTFDVIKGTSDAQE